MFQHRSNIEKALCFLKAKSVRDGAVNRHAPHATTHAHLTSCFLLQIKLVNINIPDIIDGKPSIILGLIWTIILQYHVSMKRSYFHFFFVLFHGHKRDD